MLAIFAANLDGATPALVGIAVGGAGKPSQAMETADITLMDDSIDRLPFAVSLSQATMRTIRQNLFWAFAYNTLGIPITTCSLSARASATSSA